MEPIEFVCTNDGDGNTPVRDVQAALNQPLKILSGPGEEWEVLSYYYDPEQRCMCLDIGRKE